MTLVKVNNAGQKSLSSFVDEFFHELPTSWGREGYSSFPPVNIHETADGYHLEVSAPGRSKEDFKLALESGLLTISFEKKEEAKTEEYKTIRKEFLSGASNAVLALMIASTMKGSRLSTKMVF